MSNFYKGNLNIAIFGESHGKCIGCSISNLPGGIKINEDRICKDLSLRSPHFSFNTERKEEDKVDFISGVYNGYTTGEALTFIIENKDVKSQDYENLCRPSHADYTSLIRSNGYADIRGGGSRSGRLTACLVVVGSILKEILESKNIKIYSHIARIGKIKDDECNLLELENIKDENFKVINKAKKDEMIAYLNDLKEKGDSTGGKVEVLIHGVDAGIGEPFFDSLESVISYLVFSVPGVKGIKFGKCNCNILGSEYIDKYEINNGEIKTISNHDAGINGGISNGNDIFFQTCIKPASSNSFNNELLDLENKQIVNKQIGGRHDSSFVSRVPIVLEAVSAIAICDLYMARFGNQWLK